MESQILTLTQSSGGGSPTRIDGPTERRQFGLLPLDGAKATVWDSVQSDTITVESLQALYSERVGDAL